MKKYLSSKIYTLYLEVMLGTENPWFGGGCFLESFHVNIPYYYFRDRSCHALFLVECLQEVSVSIVSEVDFIPILLGVDS